MTTLTKNHQSSDMKSQSLIKIKNFHHPVKNNLKFNTLTAQERSSRDKIIGTTQHDLFIQTTPLIKLEKRQNIQTKATEISKVTFFDVSS